MSSSRLIRSPAGLDGIYSACQFVVSKFRSRSDFVPTKIFENAIRAAIFGFNSWTPRAKTKPPRVRVNCDIRKANLLQTFAQCTGLDRHVGVADMNQTKEQTRTAVYSCKSPTGSEHPQDLSKELIL